MGDSPIFNTIKNVAGYGVGTLAALDTIKSGGLGPYLLNTQRLMSDPGFRATLAGSPFKAGVFGVSGETGPAPAPPSYPATAAGGGVVQPADMVGPPPPGVQVAPPGTLPMPSAMNVPGYLPGTPRAWAPNLPPYDPEEALKQQGLASQQIAIGAPDHFLSGIAKMQAGIMPTQLETNAVLGQAKQIQHDAGVGSTVSVKLPGMTAQIGSPYNLAAVGPGEYSTYPEAAAAAAPHGPDWIVVPTGRGTFTIAQRKPEPAGVAPLPSATTTTPASGTPPATIPTRTNNPGSIKDGPFARAQPGYVGPGPAATDGGHFAVFDSPGSGHAAMGNLLQTPAYQQLPVGAALSRWSGGGYGGEVAQAAGIDPTRPMSSLSDAERTTLTGAMAQREGFQGTLAAPPPAVAAAAPPPPPPPPAQPPAPAPTTTTTTTAPAPTTTTTLPSPPAASAAPPPPPPPHRIVRQLPDGSFAPVVPPVTAPSAPALSPPPPAPAPRRVAAGTMPAPPLLAAAAPPPAWPAIGGPPSVAAPVMVAAAPPPYALVPGAELSGIASGAPPAPAEQAVTVPQTAMPFTSPPAGEPGPPIVRAPGVAVTAPAAPVPAPPPGAPAGTRTFTETQPIKPEQGGGTVTFGGQVGAEPPKQTVTTRATAENRLFMNELGIDPMHPQAGDTELLDRHNLDVQRREAEVKADVDRLYGKIPDQEQLVKTYNYRSYITSLLTEFTPEQRAQYVGLTAPTMYAALQPWRNDPDYARFVALNAGLRSAVFAEGGRRAPTAPELQILGPILPSGRETSPASYEAALRVATDKIDNLITGYGALANMRVADLTPVQQEKIIGQYLSGPSAIHYGPYPFDQPPAAAPSTTTTTLPTPSPFVVDNLYTLPPPTPAPGP